MPIGEVLTNGFVAHCLQTTLVGPHMNAQTKCFAKYKPTIEGNKSAEFNSKVVFTH